MNEKYTHQCISKGYQDKQHVLMQREVSPPTATPKYTKEHHSVTVSSGALTGYNNGFKNCSNRNTPINQHNSQVPP